MGGDEIKSFMVIINYFLRESATPEFGYGKPGLSQRLGPFIQNRKILVVGKHTVALSPRKLSRKAKLDNGVHALCRRGKRNAGALAYFFQGQDGARTQSVKDTQSSGCDPPKLLDAESIVLE